jgi:hypothetical protein
MRELTKRRHIFRAQLGHVIALTIAIASFSCAGALENPERFQQPFDGGLVERDASVDAGQGHDVGPVPDGGTIDLESQVRDIIAAKCAGCHNATTSSGSLDLVSEGWARRVRDGAAACTAIAGQPLVDGTDVANSYFIVKLTNSPRCGVSMPFGAELLSPAEIDIFKSWLESL